MIQNPGITEIARYLADRIPTGSETADGALQDWRTTLYNARATRSERPLRDLVRRLLPEDSLAARWCEGLVRR